MTYLRDAFLLIKAHLAKSFMLTYWYFIQSNLMQNTLNENFFSLKHLKVKCTLSPSTAKIDKCCEAF